MMAKHGSNKKYPSSINRELSEDFMVYALDRIAVAITNHDVGKPAFTGMLRA
jgi:hypothetical protein